MERRDDLIQSRRSNHGDAVVKGEASPMAPIPSMEMKSTAGRSWKSSSFLQSESCQEFLLASMTAATAADSGGATPSDAAIEPISAGLPEFHIFQSGPRVKRNL